MNNQSHRTTEKQKGQKKSLRLWLHMFTSVVWHSLRCTFCESTFRGKSFANLWHSCAWKVQRMDNSEWNSCVTLCCQALCTGEMAWGGEKRKPRPHARKCVDGSIASSFVEITDPIHRLFATVGSAQLSGNLCATAFWQVCMWHGGGAKADLYVPDCAKPVCAFQ